MAAGPGSDEARRVRATMEKLAACDGDYGRLHALQAAKRAAWWEAQQGTLELAGPLSRRAYTLFLLTYLGLDPDEVPVVYEDERRIVWRSHNFCSLLEACWRLGLDTRDVCPGSEQSVQDFIAHVDPRLRFSRDYAHGIRPHAPYCEERIELEDSP